MMAIDRTHLERLRYQDDQFLLRRDLNDQVYYERQRQWWHNRAIHDAFGVAYGLTVSRSAGLERIIVEPGLAYDCFGRELIVRRQRSIGPPQTGSDITHEWTLVIRHLPTRFVGADCTSPELARSGNDAQLQWVETAQVDLRDGVPLAQGSFQSNGDSSTAFEIDDSFRPLQVRPMTRPLIGSGSTIPGQTDWQRDTVTVAETRVEDDDAEFPFFLGSIKVPCIQVTIDTSAVGFTERPCYMASVVGSRLGLADQGVVPVLIERIVRVKPDRFTCRIFATASHLVTTDELDPLLSQARKNLNICWLGIQTIREASCFSSLDPEDSAHDTL